MCVLLLLTLTLLQLSMASLAALLQLLLGLSWSSKGYAKFFTFHVEEQHKKPNCSKKRKTFAAPGQRGVLKDLRLVAGC